MSPIEFTVNLNDPALADFLADVAGTTRSFVQSATPPAGFTKQHQRENRDDKHTFEAPFLVRELYRLKLNETPQGILAAEVFLEQPVSFWVEYVLYLKDGLAPEVVRRARTLVDDYHSQSAPDLSTWIAEQIKGWLAKDEMALL